VPTVRHKGKESLFMAACPREMHFPETEADLTDSVPLSLGSGKTGDEMRLTYLWVSLQQYVMDDHH